jgi:ribonuclease HIII
MADEGAIQRLKLAGLESSADDRGNVVLLSIKNHGILRIYNTKKGITYDYSQIPSHFRQKIMDIIEPLDKEVVLGIDEAGKGDFFGPLVIAGAMVKDGAKLRAMGVVDSKKLYDDKIIRLNKVVQKECLISIVRIGPERYNEMYAKIKNLNKLLAWGHATAIENVLKVEKPDYALSDKFADERVLKSQLKELGREIKLVQRTKAESNIAVAAASVVARAEFVLALQRLSFKYGMELPLGAGENVLVAAKRFVEVHGKDELAKVCKMHFKTYKEIL